MRLELSLLAALIAIGLNACGQAIPNRYDTPRPDYINQNYLKGWAAGKDYLQKHGDPTDENAVGLMWLMLKKEQGGHLTINQLREGWRMAIKDEQLEDVNLNNVTNYYALEKAAKLYANGWVDATLGEDEPRPEHIPVPNPRPEYIPVPTPRPTPTPIIYPPAPPASVLQGAPRLKYSALVTVGECRIQITVVDGQITNLKCLRNSSNESMQAESEKYILENFHFPGRTNGVYSVPFRYTYK